MHHAYAIRKLPENGDSLLTRKFAALNNEGVRSIFPGEAMIMQAPTLLASPKATQTILRKLHCWICVAPNANSGATTLEEGQWVGMYALQGPLQPGQSNYFDKDTPLTPNGSLWISRRMYIQEQHRNMEAMMGLHQATEEHVRRHQQTLGDGTGIVRVRFTSREGSASFAMLSASTGHVAAVRPLAYRDLLEEDGTLAFLPAGLLDQAPEGTLETAWTLFEMRLDGLA